MNVGSHAFDPPCSVAPPSAVARERTPFLAAAAAGQLALRTVRSRRLDIEYRVETGELSGECGRARTALEVHAPVGEWQQEQDAAEPDQHEAGDRRDRSDEAPAPG